MSSQPTSSPVSAFTRCCFTRAPLRRSSWLKRTFFSEIAEYSFTGMFTRPKLIDPLQMARGMVTPMGRLDHSSLPCSVAGTTTSMSGGQQGPGDEVGSERREDGQVQQSGRRHHGRILPLLQC